ncbi:eCIS core domain-containing protein [Sorangium sp. So ce124]|uniref:eCIS core domain-containing protein n=1 Tax=Sorangium sp. So ce124 TaxID=3133280 RepID=UPI003F5ED6FB
MDDPLEHEADRLADAVMRMPAPARDPAAPPARGESAAAEPAPVIRRKCGACAAHEEEQDGVVLTKPDARGPAAAGAGAAAAAVAEGGAPMSPGVRSFFEPRFQRDFSRVRIHDHARAADAADAIHARAFSLGDDIAFARGEFAPATHEGARLLAHELAHVVQRQGGAGRGVITRQAAPFRQRRFQDRSGGGTTDFVETVQSAPTRSGNTISGTVHREEFAPAVGSAPQQSISQGEVAVQFDAQTCQMRLPYKFNFVQQATSGTPGICEEPASTTAVTPLSAARVQEIGREYVAAVNAGLRDQFTARITGCENNCANRDIEIVPAATLDASSPNRTVNVVNRGGRGDAGTICARDMNTGFVVHESGHQLLGMGDEYREDDPAVRQRVPQWARDERVRTDLTQLGDRHSYGRFAQYNERHFRFAQLFLEAAFPGCSVALNGITRRSPDYRLDFLAGGMLFPGGSAIALGGAFTVGLPLTRQRQLELRLGAQGIYLSTLAPLYREALLLGATAALEWRTSPANFAATFGLFGTGGVYHQFRDETTDPRAPVPARTSPYAEGGLSIGLTSGMLPSMPNIDLQVEGALGHEIRDDPAAMRWFRFGAALNFTF